MPELPEVEVTRLSLVGRLRGAVIQCVEMGKPLRWPLGVDPDTLVGLQILNVRRRGKYLLIDLSDGLLLVHLGMSGSLSFAPPGGLVGRHDHCDISAVVFAKSEDAANAQKLLGHLGVEPLGADFVASAFHLALKTCAMPIKQALLAGHIVVGVGNIYASEALFLARIRPTLRANKLSGPRAGRLHAAVREVLARAVASGGSTLRDFSSATGESGHFQLQANVYDRAGDPCRVCSKTIKRIVQGQRSTFYCPDCQKI
jgi:formamidopyrimidine-DNA glycosylase